jgi:hypothetical protein
MGGLLQTAVSYFILRLEKADDLCFGTWVVFTGVSATSLSSSLVLFLHPVSLLAKVLLVDCQHRLLVIAVAAISVEVQCALSMFCACVLASSVFALVLKSYVISCLQILGFSRRYRRIIYHRRTENPWCIPDVPTWVLQEKHENKRSYHVASVRNATEVDVFLFIIVCITN